MEDENILYELICCGEWKDEREEQLAHLLPSKNSAGIFSYVNSTRLFRKKLLSVPESVKWLKSLGPPWQISLSPDGNIIAVLQNFTLETRSVKDNFISPLGRSTVLKDPHFALRLMVWSVDSSMLAISFSNGQIILYDIMASQLCSVRRCALPSQEELPADVFSSENPLVGLFFATERVKKHTYTNELISIDSRGFIKCFRQTNADQMTFHHDASVRSYYSKGVFSTAYVESNGILLVSGPLDIEVSSESKEKSQTFGITIWRLINDTPYYRIMFNVSHDQFRMDSRRRWKFAVSALFPDSTRCEDAIFKMVLSPEGKHVAALHTSGTISVWHLPSLQLYRSWPLKNQFHHWTENSRFNNRWRVAFNRWHEEHIDNWRFHPQDINWWNDTILIISRVNGCVSLCSMMEEHPSKNLLGDSPEVFESPVSVTSRHGKGFLALECELRLKVEERRDANGDLVQSSESTSLELLDAYDSQFLPKTLIQEVLFWMTDIERFRPPRKRKRKPPVWKETHRLFLLRKITPQELFHQKIEAEEYGEALDLARAYKLDSDLVYQRQWSKAPVSVHTIRDYLGKIKKRNWVLQECLERVPHNADAAQELLGFGLKGTDLSAAVTISQGKDKGMFYMLTPDDLDISHEDYLMLLDADNLEVKRLLSYRKQFLYYLDILNTYELIIGGPTMVDENFDGATYARLRSKNPVESAVEMARSNDISALRIMLSNHWFEIAPQYLSVLSSFPETTCPHDYSDFLPEIDSTGEVLLWDEIVSKDKDWCERFLETGMKLRRSSAGSLVADISIDQVSMWYEDRIRDIEKFSGITSYSLDLARLGVNRNIPGLKSLLEDLEIVEMMVYDAKVDITLEILEDLSPLDRLELLVSNSNEKTFIHHIREFVIPFLEKCEMKEKGTRFHLFDQYLTSISTQDLTKPLLIFENSKPGSVNPIVSNITELMRIAHNCIFACKVPNQTNNILAILDCLPERNRATTNENLKELHDAIDDLELHYQGVQILEKYEIPITVHDLKDFASSDEADDRAQGFFRRICDAPRWKKPPMKVNEWKSMLYDVLDLQKKVFKDFPVETCFELYVAALLRSGSAEVINLARDFIDRNCPKVENNKEYSARDSSSNKFSALVRRVSSAYSTAFSLYLYLIPYEKSLEMVTTAAQHYFDSASNYADPDIELCKMCLNLMQNLKEPVISQIFDLIDAVKIINKEFQVNILPQTVRLTRNKSGLVKQSMENIPDGYKKTQQLLKLALFLKLEDMSFPETESWVFDMSGDAALVESDMKFCVQMCQKIIAKGYHTGWKVFTQIAKYQSDPPIVDHETRLAFINYALNMCPEDEIMNVLNSKYLIEIRSLQSRISELSPENSTLDESLKDVAENDNTVQDTLNLVKLQEFLNTTTSWISPLKNMAHVVSTRSGSLLNSARIAGLITDSSSEMNLSHSIHRTTDENELNSNFVQESYPAFYLNEREQNSRYFHQSRLAFQYNTFSSSRQTYAISNPALELCITLNRIWHLERSLLGSEECGSRDDIVEQLVAEVLPEDIPWGLAILFSIENIETLRTVLSQIPVTPVSLTVILYFLSLAIYKHLGDLEEIVRRDANQVILEIEEYINNDHVSSDDNNSLLQLIELFKDFKAKLNNFKRSL